MFPEATLINKLSEDTCIALGWKVMETTVKKLQHQSKAREQLSCSRELQPLSPST